MAALVKSFLYLCLLRTALTLCNDLLGPAFMVVATIALAGLKEFFDLLVVRTNLHTKFNFSFITNIGQIYIPLVVWSSTDTNNLVVNKTVVSLGISVGQIAGLGGERFLDTPLLEQKAARVTDDSPGDIS